MRGKLSELHFDVLLFSDCGEKVQTPWQTKGQICPIVFSTFYDFSPRLENKDTVQISSDSFPRLVTYILCVENCRNYILMHSCLPSAGRLF